MYWIQLAHDMVQWEAHVNTIMNFPAADSWADAKILVNPLKHCGYYTYISPTIVFKNSAFCPYSYQKVPGLGQKEMLA
jgi:hypothetical protein